MFEGESSSLGVDVRELAGHDSEPRCTTLKLYLQAKARIWARLSYMFRSIFARKRYGGYHTIPGFTLHASVIKRKSMMMMMVRQLTSRRRPRGRGRRCRCASGCLLPRRTSRRWGLGVRVQGLGHLGLRVQGLGSRDQGSRIMEQDLGVRV